MRITIGGILLVGGVVAAVAIMGPLGNPGDVVKQAVDGVTSLAKSVSGPAVIPVASSVSPNSEPATSAAAAVSTVTAQTPAVATPVQPVPAVVKTQPVVAPEPVAAQPAVERHGKHKRRRLHRVKAPVAAKSSVKVLSQAGNATPPGASADPLVGQYVAVKLKTGREVKGILRGKNSQGISLEIPGMGPFQYPSSNIEGIKTAE